jgi:hypothetical protein
MALQRKVKRKSVEEQRSENAEDTKYRNTAPEINETFNNVLESGEIESDSPEIPHYDLGLRDWFLKNQLECVRL